MVGHSLSQQLAHLRVHTDRFALRAACLAAVAGIALGGLPQAAAAQGIFPGTFVVRDGVFYDPPPPPPPWATARYTIDFTRTVRGLVYAGRPEGLRAKDYLAEERAVRRILPLGSGRSGLSCPRLAQRRRVRGRDASR